MLTQIIAEAGVNHNGSFERALEMIRVAADAGATAIKFQTFRAEKLVTKLAKKADYQVENTQQGGSQLDMIRALQLDESAHRKLVEHARARGIQFLSTPFDHASVDLLVSLGAHTMKIASGEVTHRSLLHKVASTQLPVLLSTGMSSLGEIESALGVLAAGFLGLSDSPADCESAWLSEAGQRMLSMNVTLLHCTTEYPAPPESINLNAMNTLANAFGLPVGYSDHSEGIDIAAAAVAMGALCIEKHFTLDRSLPGPDHKASLEPHELAAMVKSIRKIEAAMGTGRKLPADAELKNREVARRSLVAARDIAKGEIFSAENLAAKRPATGISPMRVYELIGQPAARDYREDDLILG